MARFFLLFFLSIYYLNTLKTSIASSAGEISKKIELIETTDDDISDISLSAEMSSSIETLESKKVEIHKDLFPLDLSDFWGTLLVTGGLLIAASGGIGGGGILVPLLILVYGFSPKNAVALSNFCIVGSSITNMVLNIFKRHPSTDRPLVDWDLILVMEPLTMAGAVIGAFMSVLLPEWILVIALVLLLAFTTWTTLEKGISQYKKETKQQAAEAKSALALAAEKQLELQELSEKQGLLDDVDEPSSEPPSEPSSTKDAAVNDSNSTLSTLESGIPPSLPEIYQDIDEQQLSALLEAEKNTPFDKVVILSVMVSVVIALNLVKGGSGKNSFPSPLGVKCGSSGYWAITGLVIVFVLIVSVWMRSGLIEKWRLKKRLRYKYVEGDVEWNEYHTVLYPCICFFAGFFAGMFGVGGGIVKGPLMLYMGVHPLVASATCAVMIMFTSVAATTMFIAFGTLIWDYGIFLFIIGLVATVVGQFGVSYLVQKYKRVSLVSLSIGAVVAISTVLMAIQSVFSLIEAQKGNGGTSQLCSSN